ncbi:6-phosphogluconolactonase [uncultured Nitratireductor sp.]|uniref:6-phosphogluconolactonase n=1 Tax=uncultured Nitratireductor sp. TaxID=520953 RepID=UPI0025E34CD2|nr:6-phosphogluconolactonase [uncultured Nitratireductor sp.]
MGEYQGIDDGTQAALRTDEQVLRAFDRPALSVHNDADALCLAMAERLFTDIRDCLREKGRCSLIVPVGPVGQYQLLAERCAKESLSLSEVTFIVMDEYLQGDNSWISEHDPLSFRGHMQRNLMEQLPEAMRPRLLVPDPHALDAIPRFIEANRLDFTYAGIGITGHLAFNDPMEGVNDADWFAALPTRIVHLCEKTRLINSVTAARGNIQRIPAMAVTVGMKEILSARKLRIWMNRQWQSAAIRRMLLAPETAAFPASLVRRHAEFSVDVTAEVLAAPEPGLR